MHEPNISKEDLVSSVDVYDHINGVGHDDVMRWDGGTHDKDELLDGNCTSERLFIHKNLIQDPGNSLQTNSPTISYLSFCVAANFSQS